MKNITILLLLTFTINLSAQKLKKMSENLVYAKGKYYVLKTDLKTRHGKYYARSYTPPFRKLITGQYLNGKKTGIWIEKYDKRGNITKSKGEYLNDLKIGLWKYYLRNGKLSQEFDHDKNIVISSYRTNNSLKKKYEIIFNNEVIESYLDSPPTYIGGEAFLMFGLHHVISKKSPFEISENERTIININERVSFYVSKSGKVEKIELTGKEKNKKLYNVLKDWLNETGDNWIPGVLNNKKIAAKLEFPIRIKMQF
jgi:hypothetical protein